MKATGIVGRVVIPKEIRRTMRIREGDPLEIFTNREGEVIFKKYSPIGELGVFAAQYAETLYKTADLPVVICDKDSVIACAGVPKKEFIDRRVSPAVEELMEKRTLTRVTENSPLPVTGEGDSAYSASVVMPITAQGDVIGAVLSMKTADKPGAVPEDAETKLVQTAAGFLGKQLED